MLGFLKFFGNGGNGVTHVPGVLSKEAFAEALSRERSRADRTGLPFSLAVMWDTSAPGPESLSVNGNRVLPRLAKVLTARVRCTDIVGWLERDKLGVLLPHTPGERAWSFVDDVDRRLKEALGADDVSGVSYGVHTYPLGDLGQANGVRQLRLFARTADDLERASENTSDAMAT